MDIMLSHVRGRSEEQDPGVSQGEELRRVRGGVRGDGDLRRGEVPRVHRVDRLDTMHQVMWRGEKDKGKREAS